MYGTFQEVREIYIHKYQINFVNFADKLFELFDEN